MSEPGESRRGDLPGERSASHERYRALASVVDGGVLELDADGLIAAVDDEFVERTRFDRADVRGERAPTLFGDGADRVSEELQRLREATGTTGSADGSEAAGTGDGSEATGKGGGSEVAEPDGDSEATGTGDARALTLSVETASENRVRSELSLQPVTVDGEFDGAVGVLRDVRTDDAVERGGARTDDAVERGDAPALEARERALRDVYEVVTDPDWSFSERVDALLEVVKDAVGTDYATLSRVRGDEYVFEAVDAPDGVDLESGDVVPLDELPVCARVVQAERTLVFRDVAAQAPELVDPEWGISRYLGAPAVVDGDVYGTFCFYGTEPADDEFTEWQVTLVDLAAQWVSYELTQRRTRERLERRSEAVEASHRRYETLVGNIPNGAVGLVDDDLRYVTVGGSPIDAEDVTAEDMEGERIEDVLSDRVAEAVVPRYRAALNGEESTFELEVGDGVSRFHVFPVDDGGEVTAAIGMSQDVTEQKEREARLAKYETIFETLNDGIYVADEEGYYETVNEAFAELTGYGKSELLGEHATRVVDEATLDRASEVRESAAGDGTTPSLETTVETADGSEVPVEVTFSSLEAGDGDGERVGVVRDVSERRERRRQIEESEQRYRALVENFPNGAVGLFDDDLRYTAVGGELFEATDVSREERVGYSVFDLYPDDIVDEVEPHFRAALDGEPESFDVQFRGRHLSARVLPVGDTGDSVDAGMLVVQDVTERMEHERELERRARQQQVVANLGQFALDADDIDELMDEAARQVADVLENDYCKVLDLDDDERELLLRQGVGWDDGIVGHATVDADAGDSQAGYTLRSDDPVVVDDLATEDRFSGPELLTSHDVSSGVSTIIGPIDDPWGILGTHDTARKEFSAEDVNFVQSVANILADAIERDRYNAELERTIDDLEESEQRYRALVENLPHGGVGVFDGDLRYTLVEGTMWDDIDVDADDLQGETIWESLPDDTAADVEPVFRAALDGETDSVVSTLDGRTYRVWATPLRNADGEITAGQSIALDVTEQKEHEQFLEDAKSQMEAAAEAGAVGTWEWQVGENDFVADAALARLFGVDPEAAREGVPLEELTSSIHEDDVDRVEAAIEEAVETGGEYEEEYRVYDADGDVRWVVARGHVNCDEDGDPETFPGAITDITEQKRVEREIEQHRRQLETLFEVMPVGVIVADASGSFVEVNDIAKRLWDVDSRDVSSVDEYDHYDAWWPETGEPVDPDEFVMARVLRGEEAVDPDIYAIEDADGNERTVMVRGMPVFDEDGDVVRGVTTVTDITERREYQRKLEESNERLEQFAYAASHDLQEPLRMVSSYLSLIEDRYGDVLDEDGQEFLEYAVDGADRMQEMIDALLQYSRVETRGDAMESVSLESVFDDVRRDYEMKIRESDADVTVESLPTVRGDEDQLREVFGNLLSNAIEYSGDDPPTVHVSAERRGDDWVLGVRDNGIGIEPEHVDRIFDVFQRLHTREEHPGTGIGLALTQRIVERHGGDIWVESEPGEGSTFYFSIPDREHSDD